MRRREGVLGEGVRRGLVVADVQRVRERADLVERAAQEELVARHAGEVERRRRHQEDLVARARQVELLLAAVLEVGDDRLPRALEVDDRVAHFLHLAPERGGAGRPDDDARDAPVDLGLAQRVDERAHGRRRLEELADDAARLDLLEVAARRRARSVELDEICGPRPAGKAHEDQPGRRDGDGHEDEDEHDQTPRLTATRGLLRSSIAAFAKAMAASAGFARETCRAVPARRGTCRLLRRDCRLRRRGGLPVDDVVDGGHGADILHAVQVVRRVEDDGAGTDALPLPEGQRLERALPEDDQLFIAVLMRRMRRLRRD